MFNNRSCITYITSLILYATPIINIKPFSQMRKPSQSYIAEFARGHLLLSAGECLTAPLAPIWVPGVLFCILRSPAHLSQSRGPGTRPLQGCLQVPHLSGSRHGPSVDAAPRWKPHHTGDSTEFAVR